MVIVDTTVWIDYLRAAQSAEAAWLEREMGQQALGLTDLILCEVLQGLRDETAFLGIQAQLADFHIFNTGGEGLAVASARNYQFLRRQGHTVRKTIDCFIATFCIEENHQLLHRDRDFDSFEKYLGLSVLHP